MKCCEFGTMGCVYNTYISSQLMNRPNKLECYITLSWKGFSGTSALAYWTHLYLTKKIKCCEFVPRSLYYKTFTAVIVAVS